MVVIPALVVLGLGLALRARGEPLLGRMSGWPERIGAEATAWVLGIAGFVVAGAASRLLG